MAKLTTTAGLANKSTFDPNRSRNRLSIGNLGTTNVGLHPELALQAVDNDIQMQLTHTGDDRLSGLLVIVDLEGRILFRQLDQRIGQLVLIGLGLGFDGNLDHRIRELDRFQQNRILGIRERLTREGLLQTDNGGNITGVTLLDLFALVSVHLKQDG